jgi:glycosyltransferase involved in cell wall biosynthesis
MSVNTRLTVTHFYREPGKGFSAEGIFKTVKNDLDDRLPIRDAYCDPKSSHLKNTLEAAKKASAVNHLIGDAAFLLRGLKGHKNIITILDPEHLAHEKRSRLKSLFSQPLLPLKHVNVVTVISEATKQKCSQLFRFPSERIQVIPPPVKPTFKYMYKDELANKPVILILGTAKHKNLYNLIDAVKDLNVHISIVGEPSIDDTAKLNACNLSYTIYKQLSDEEVFDRYTQCDMVFAAPLTEGSCMPVIEAQAVGRPVIASNLNAVNEIAGNAAMLIDPTRPDHIRDAFTTLIADRQRYGTMVTQGLRNAARFHHKLISEQYFRLYLDLHKQ